VLLHMLVEPWHGACIRDEARFWGAGANGAQYIMYHSEYWFNVHGMWKGWPFREITGLSKFYYLVQWGFWIQQIVVVHIEEKRKDYAQMFTHHIFTCALLFLSYGYYHTRVGIVILCIMDIVDIVLPVSFRANGLARKTNR
jgi:acyl-CoA-dependent ceramide synthase